MKRFCCLLITLVLAMTSVSALAEKVSVRGVDFGMTIEDIKGIEDANGNGNYLSSESEKTVKYEGIYINGEEASVGYIINQTDEGLKEIWVSIDFNKLEYKDLNWRLAEIYGKHSPFDEDPELTEILDKIDDTFNDTKSELIKKYGQPIASSKDGTLTVVSAGGVDVALSLEDWSKKEVYDNGEGDELIDYNQWLVEFDDCWLAIDLISFRNHSLISDIYSCSIDYKMYDKSAYDFNSMELVVRKGNSDF